MHEDPAITKLQEAVKTWEIQQVNDERILTKVPYFIQSKIEEQITWIECSYMQQLVNLEMHHPGCFITEPTDRDYAYREHLELEEFEGDL